MNIQKINFEDLLTRYYYDTEAYKVAQDILCWIAAEQNTLIAKILRNHRIDPVTEQVEIAFRAKMDRLLKCCSVMEIALLCDFISDIQLSTFGRIMHIILDNDNVRRYYEEFYPAKLPQLFRLRLSGINRNRVVTINNNENGSILLFLDLDRRFSENVEEGVFLQMLDSSIVQGYSIDDIITIIKEPGEFINGLLLSNDEDNIPSQILDEFSFFMQFCFDLHQFLALSATQPLLQSAIWHYYGYWFDTIGDKLKHHLDRMLLQFLEWNSLGDTDKVIPNYVAEALVVLESLTSGILANPVNALIKDLASHDCIEEKIESELITPKQSNPSKDIQYWNRAKIEPPVSSGQSALVPPPL